MLANPGLFKRSRLQWLLNTATLKLPLTNSDTLDSRITATRASTKTYFDSTGTMRTAAINEFPREYNPSTLVCLGRSFWEARTNLLTYSEQFDNAAWTKTRSSITANATTAPDGTVTADKLVEDTTASNTHIVYQFVTSSSSVATYSFFAKAGERSSVVVQLYTSPANTGGQIDFDLFSIAASSSVALGTGAVTASSIVNVGNDWRLCSISVSGTASTSIAAVIYLKNGTTNNYTGDGTSGLYLWGAQLEAGATPTPYIPTTTASATRAADVVSMTGTNFSSWYNQTEGTFLATAMVPYLDAAGTNRRTFDVTDGTSSNRMGSIHANQGGVTRATWLGATAAVAQFDLNSSDASGNTTDGTFYSSAFAYKVNDFAASHRGNAVLTDTSGTVPTVNQINIGSLIGSLTFHNGFISRIIYWNRRLSNADLQILSR